MTKNLQNYDYKVKRLYYYISKNQTKNQILKLYAKLQLLKIPLFYKTILMYKSYEQSYKQEINVYNFL